MACKGFKNEKVRELIREKIVEMIDIYADRISNIRWHWERKEVAFYFNRLMNGCNFLLRQFTGFSIESEYDMYKNLDRYKELRTTNEQKELSYYMKRFPFILVGYIPCLIAENMVACCCFPCIISSLLKEDQETEQDFWKVTA